RERADGFHARQDVVQLLRAQADHGFYFVGRVALVLQVATYAVEEEVGDRFARRLDRRDAGEGLFGQTREAVARAESGEAKLVIGTHALIQDTVRFARLGLAV